MVAVREEEAHREAARRDAEASDAVAKNERAMAGLVRQRYLDAIAAVVPAAARGGDGGDAMSSAVVVVLVAGMRVQVKGRTDDDDAGTAGTDGGGLATITAIESDGLHAHCVMEGDVAPRVIPVRDLVVVDRPSFSALYEDEDEEGDQDDDGNNHSGGGGGALAAMRQPPWSDVVAAGLVGLVAVGVGRVFVAGLSG